MVAGIAVILLVWALVIGEFLFDHFVYRHLIVHYPLAVRRCCRRDADKSGVDPVFLGQKPERLASFEQIPAGQGGPIRRSSPPLPASLQPGSKSVVVILVSFFPLIDIVPLQCFLYHNSCFYIRSRWRQ